MDDTLEENLCVNDIGNIAKIIDAEMTIIERMKIKKTTLIKMIGAVIVYLAMMYIFYIFL